MPLKARLYISIWIAIGAAFLAATVHPWQAGDIARFCFYLILQSLASGMKVNLPGVPGTISVCFLFSLIGIAEMTLGETAVIGAMGVLIQCLWRIKEKPGAAQVF